MEKDEARGAPAAGEGDTAATLGGVPGVSTTEKEPKEAVSSDAGRERWPGGRDTGVGTTLLLDTVAAGPTLVLEMSTEGEDSGTVGLEGKSVS